MYMYNCNVNILHNSKYYTTLPCWSFKLKSGREGVDLAEESAW